MSSSRKPLNSSADDESASGFGRSRRSDDLEAILGLAEELRAKMPRWHQTEATSRDDPALRIADAAAVRERVASGEPLDPAILERMVRAGVDVVRLNFSHGTADDHLQRATLVKEISRKTGRTVAIMCDLQGPKIRVGKFKNGKVSLGKGQAFILDAACEIGDEQRVCLDYKELPRDVSAGAVLLLDDGKIVLDVTAVQGDEVDLLLVSPERLSNPDFRRDVLPRVAARSAESSARRTATCSHLSSRRSVHRQLSRRSHLNS